MLAVALLALVGLSACQTTAVVRVAVQPDGSGSVAIDVRLDAEAVARVGDLSRLVVLDDLEAAGWTVTGPGPSQDVERLLTESGEVPPDGPGASESGEVDVVPPGEVRLHLARDFADIEEANDILASLSGPDGPLRDVALGRQSSLFSTEWSFAGTVDLSEGLDTFGDEALTRTLGGTLDEVVAASPGGAPDADALRVALELEPSTGLDWSGEMGNVSVNDATVAAEATLGSAPESVDVTARQTRWVAVGIAAALVVLVLTGLVVVGFSFRRSANRAERLLLPGRAGGAVAAGGLATVAGDLAAEDAGGRDDDAADDPSGGDAGPGPAPPGGEVTDGT